MLFFIFYIFLLLNYFIQSCDNIFHFIIIIFILFEKLSHHPLKNIFYERWLSNIFLFYYISVDYCRGRMGGAS